MSVSAVAIAVVLAGGSPLTDRLPWDGHSLRVVRDEGARLAMPVPLTGVLLERRTFRDAAAGEQFRHRFVLSSVRGEAVEVGVFENPKGLSVDDFVTHTLAVLRLNEHAVMEWTATRASVRALLFDLPRSEQQYAQRVAVFAVGARVFMVSCRNVDDAFALAAFTALVSGLEVDP
jgi:hypothetical protein